MRGHEREVTALGSATEGESVSAEAKPVQDTLRTYWKAVRVDTYMQKNTQNKSARVNSASLLPFVVRPRAHPLPGSSRVHPPPRSEQEDVPFLRNTRSTSIRRPSSNPTLWLSMMRRTSVSVRSSSPARESLPDCRFPARSKLEVEKPEGGDRRHVGAVDGARTDCGEMNGDGWTGRGNAGRSSQLPVSWALLIELQNPHCAVI